MLGVQQAVPPASIQQERQRQSHVAGIKAGNTDCSSLGEDSGRTVLWTSCNQGTGGHHQGLLRLFLALGQKQLE